MSLCGANPNHTFGDLPFTVSASASSGLPISFSSNTPLVCSVGGNVVTAIASGTCTLVAAQAGSGAAIKTATILCVRIS